MINNKTQQQKRTVISYWSLVKGRAGQSLIEVMIALTIGSLLIGAASLGITFILRSSTTNQKLQSASGFTGDLVDRMRSVSSADWQNIYGLTKGTSTAYFVNASGTTLFILEGKEGVLGDDVSNGLVGHWKFDEATSTTATSTYDASGNNNHGTLINGVLRASSTCQVSHCLSFDGTNDYVTMGDILEFERTDSFSFSVWLKSNQTATTETWGIITKQNSLSPFTGYALFVRGDITGDPYEMLLTNTISSNDILVRVDRPSNTEWHHVAMTYDGNSDESGIQIYINGSSGDNRTVVRNNLSASILTDFNLQIGARNGTESPFDGLIDDVRIYNRALSADEINRLYGSTVFTRYFNVENISRDSGGDIVTSGGNDDPSTQKITSYVEWSGVENAIGQVKVVDFITRWSNRVFNQTDWSGGSGEDGPIADPSSKYSSSTGISGSTVGSIKIEGL